MGLNAITFEKGKNGLGRPLPGKDYYSGLISYIDNTTLGTYLTGIATTDRIKLVKSLAEAEALGIVGTFPDETKATGTYLITSAGAEGDKIELKVVEPKGTVSLGVYTRSSSESTVGAIATALAAVINSGTSSHGYSATVSTATVTITARKGLGSYLNLATKLSAVITGTITATLTDFSGGVASKVTPLWYHLSECFRMNPKAYVYVGIYATPSANFDEVKSVQDYALGEIRQIAVWDVNTAFSTAKVLKLQAIAETLDGEKKPVAILYSADFVGITAANHADLSSQDSELVSVVNGQDGANFGFELFKGLGKSISCIGNALGVESAGKVSECMAWVGKNNLSDGEELDVAAFANGDFFSTTSEATLSDLNNKRYIFLRKFVGKTGTYFNDSHTCTLVSSDYAKRENVRTIQKLQRKVYADLLDDLNSPLKLNADGTLTEVKASYFEDKCKASMAEMERDEELSASDANIDRSQNIASTNRLDVSIEAVPIGTANNIKVKLGFTAKIK